MNMLRKTYSCCVLVTLAAFCTVAAAASPAPSQIKVGVLYASAGPFGPVSTDLHNGLELWVKEINAGGGAYVKPYHKKIPIRLISYNDESSTATAAALYDRLITQNKVDILVADAGSVLTSVAVPIAESHKMLLLDQTGSSPKFFTPNNPYIVQLGLPVTPLWSKMLGKFLTNVAVHHDIKRVAILYATNDFCTPQAESLKQDLGGDKNIKIVYFHGVPTGTNSYTVLLHSILATHPDAVIEFGYPNNDTSFLRDVESNELHFKMIFTSFAGLSTDIIRKTVGNAGMMDTFSYATAINLNYKPTVGMNLTQFEAAYRKMFGAEANLDFNSTDGYSTGLIIQEALKNTDSLDQLSLRKAIFALSGNLTTVNGHFKLNKDGSQAGMLFPIGQIQPKGSGLQLVTIYPSDVAEGNPIWPGK